MAVQENRIGKKVWNLSMNKRKMAVQENRIGEKVWNRLK